MVRYLVLIALSFIWAVSLRAQHRDTLNAEVQKDLERALEDLDPSDPAFESTMLTQYLQDLAASPVNINTADITELLKIPAMNLQMATAIVAYRSEIKPFENVYELEQIEGIGSATLSALMPYVTAGSPGGIYSDRRYWTHKGRVDILTRFQRILEEQEGYNRSPEKGGYIGGPNKYYQRFRYRSTHLSVNTTQEKDPGEPLEGKLGFDFISGHLALTDNGKLQRLVLGDYGLSFGQGLVLWNGGFFGKGREAVRAVSRNERGVFPYASAQETDFYRGVAVTYGEQLQVSGFYSKRKRSATVVAGDTVRYPRSNGLHRTLTERNVLNNLDQETYGARLRGSLPMGFVGLTAYRVNFSKFIDPGDALHNRYDFRGTSSASLGLDYAFMFGSATLFGEAARSENGGYGLLSGVEGPLAEETDIVVAYRHYSKDYQALLGNGFGESSGGSQNERGIYLGMQHTLGNGISLSGYFDQFWFPEPKFGTAQSTKGYEWLLYAGFRLNRSLQLYLQLRSDSKEDEFETVDFFGRSLRKLGVNRRRSVRGHLEYRVNRKFRIRTRAEVIQSRQGGAEEEIGYLLYQDLRYSPSNRWSVDMRATVFETESFNSRVYQFENDLLYVMSNEMLYGRGQRFYILVNYEPFSFLELWTKFGVTIYEDQLTVGSGLNQIRGNRRSDLGVQIRFQF